MLRKPVILIAILIKRVIIIAVLTKQVIVIVVLTSSVIISATKFSVSGTCDVSHALYYNRSSRRNNFPLLILNAISLPFSFYHTLITSPFSDILYLLPTSYTLPPITLLLQYSPTSIYSTAMRFSLLPLLCLKYILTTFCTLPYHLYYL